MVLILHIMGFFAIIIPLWVMAPRGNAHVVLLEFTNFGGWSSTGLSSMIGLLAPVSFASFRLSSLRMVQTPGHSFSISVSTAMLILRN